MLPDAALGVEPGEAPAAEAASDGEAPKPKKKTRRGTRGGRNRKKRTPAAAQNGGESTSSAEDEPVGAGPAPDTTTWDYVPMSEWGDEIVSDDS